MTAALTLTVWKRRVWPLGFGYLVVGSTPRGYVRGWCRNRQEAAEQLPLWIAEAEAVWGS